MNGPTSEAPGPDWSTTTAERRHAYLSPLLLVLKYQQQVLTTLAALAGAALVAAAVVLAVALAAGAIAGRPLLRLGGPSAMHWIVVLILLPVALLIATFVPKPARVPFVLVAGNPLGLLGLGWLALERLVNRLGAGGGVVGLLLGLLMSVFAIASLDTSLGALLRTAEALAGSWPVVAGLVVALGLPLALLPWYITWVVVRAAITMLRLSARERTLLRDAPAGAGIMTRAWGMPPTLAFARLPRRRFVAIVVLSVLAAFCFAIASTVVIVSPSFLRRLEMVAADCAARDGGKACLEANLPLFLGGSSIATGAAVAACVALGAACQRAARRRVRFSLEALQRIDARPPLLFLRAFADDQVPVPPSTLPWLSRLLEVGRRRTSLDQMLLDEGTSYGPVVALGKPDDKRPPYGAARGYFANRDWQAAVADLAQRSTAIVLCLDDTDGIWWEVEHLVASRHLAKTLFLVHPKHRDPKVGAGVIGRLARALGLDRASTERLLAAPPRAKRKPEALIGFFVAPGGALHLVRSETHAHLAYLLLLRLFLRERLHLATQPL